MPTELHTLPVELLYQIVDLLPISSLVSLKLTGRRLFVQLPSPPTYYIKTAPSCERRAIRRYISEAAEAAGGRRKCILCNGLMPLTFFRSAALPVCKWHDGWFCRSPDTIPIMKGPRIDQTGCGLQYSTTTKILCAHCKVVRSWDGGQCPCQKGDGCESCGSWVVPCFLRSWDR